MPAARAKPEASSNRSRPASAGGENFDLSRVLLRGRRKTLAERTKDWTAYLDSTARSRRKLYMRRMMSPMDREVQVWDEEQGRTRPMLMFGSNNYLGLATHPHIIEEVERSARTWGAGVAGPPLLNGYTDLHRSLEERLAEWKGSEDALLFSSGYGANLGLAAGLLQPTDRVLYDEMSHASFDDGLRLSRAHARRFPHNEVDTLESLLQAEDSRRCDTFVAVEGVYSMEGDTAPLDRLVPLCRRCGALLIVDDAHGSAVMGPEGRGTASHYGVEAGVDLTMGTFSKAFGVTGGFVAGRRDVMEYLRFFARSYVFSAALPPPVAAAVHAGLDVLEDEPERVRQLHDNVRYAAAELRRIGFDVRPLSAIVSLKAPAMLDFQAAAERFDRLGLFVNATQFPAVARDRQQFRISFMATHTRADLDRLVAGVEEVWETCSRSG